MSSCVIVVHSIAMTLSGGRLCIKWSQSHFCHPEEATLEFWHCSQMRSLVLGFRSFALKFRVWWNFHVVLHVESRKEWHTAGVLSTALLHNSNSWIEASVWNFFFWTGASWPRGNHVSLHCRNYYTCSPLFCIRNYATFLWWPFFNRTMYSVNSDGILVQRRACVCSLHHNIVTYSLPIPNPFLWDALQQCGVPCLYIYLSTSFSVPSFNFEPPLVNTSHTISPVLIPILPIPQSLCSKQL